jgi:hypothetical protein
MTPGFRNESEERTLLEISPMKVAHIVVRARELDAKVAAWDDPARGGGMNDDEADCILEDTPGDATRDELSEFIANLNDDEKAGLVAIAWVGRGSFSADEYEEALETARTEQTNRTEDYLLGMPLLADYLEEGLDKLGYSVEEAEDGVL